MIREVLSYFFLGAFPIFEISCYYILRQKKNKIMIQKRDISMIYISTIAAWISYVNLINSLFGGIYCGLYHIFVILLSPLSVGPQLLRGIRLWGMLERNRILFNNFEEYGTHSMGNGVTNGLEDSLHVINEVNSSKEEHSQLSEVNILVNKRNITNDKLKKVKNKVIRMVGITRLILIVLPTMLIIALLTMAEKDKLSEVEFEKCFPEPTFILNAGRSISIVLSLAAFCTTIFMSQCHDELGIHMEIIRNIVILFVTNVLGFVCRYIGLIQWQAFVFVIQQVMVSFSMIIIPCMYDSSVLSWMKNKSKKLVHGYARPLPQLPHTRGSILLPNKRISQVNQKENNKREREVTMSLDAGLCILLSSSEGIKAFTEHCSREFSVENIKFWSEVNEFHGAVDKLRDSEGSSTHDEKDILTFAKEIYQTFIVEGAQMQINISEAQSLSITQRLESNESTVSRDLFDKAQKEIYVLMSRHSYPRFLSSNGNRSYKKREEEKIKTKKSSVLPDNT